MGRDLFQVEEAERQGDKGWKVGVVWLRSGVFSSGIIISANDSGEITIDLITSMGWHWFGLRCNCFVNVCGPTHFVFLFLFSLTFKTFSDQFLSDSQFLQLLPLLGLLFIIYLIKTLP